jgi:hypothetical protein
MNAITTAPARQTAQVQPVLVPRTFDQLVTFAEMAAVSGMVPKAYENKPGAIMVAVQMGSELGLSPMQSINSIAVINGRPGVWGDGLIGICRQSPMCQDIVETMSGEGEARTAKCVATRRGATPCTATFSVADAKKAGLWGKDIWAKYPDRMLQNRARGFALRDAFPDLLRGLKTVEELRDTPETFRGTTLDAEPARTHPISPEPLRRAAASGAFSDEPMGTAPPQAAPYTPPAEPRRTIRDWLNDLRVQLAAAHTLAAVDAIATSDEVMAALRSLRNGAREELNALLAEAIERTTRPEGEEPNVDSTDEADDTFPGDLPLKPAATEAAIETY